MKILIIGVTPPPIGGVSIHIERLYRRMLSEGYDVDVLNYMFKNSWLKLLRTLIKQVLYKEYDIMHLHVSACGKLKFILPLLLIISRISSVIITIHSGSFKLSNNQRMIFKFMLRRVKAIIAVNNVISNLIESLKINGLITTCIPAYIMNSNSCSSSKFSKLDSGKKNIVTSGYLTKIYNYEVLLDAISLLKDNDLVFHFAFYNEIDLIYKSFIEEKIKRNHNIRVHYDLHPDEFKELLLNSDAYIRTTITDGDSIALREALEYKKIVIATDVVKRPDGCYLFKPNDSKKLASYFEMIDKLVPIATGTEDYYPKVINLYTDILNQTNAK